MSQQKKNLSDREVTEHTAALWRYKAVPTKDKMPEPAPEQSEPGNHTIGKFQVISARVRGKKHKHDGSNCDDWFQTENVDGIFVSAVSDGAGSKKFSRIGAQEACKSAVFFVKINLERLLSNQPTFREDLAREMTDKIFSDAASLLANLVQEAMLTAREAIITAYESRRGYTHYTNVVGRELQLNDFACTLLLTVAIPFDDRDEILVVACQVGDGIIATMNTNETYDKALSLLGMPDSGKFSGVTDFLTSSKFSFKENLISRTKLSRKKIDLIFSMTDGVADDYDPNDVQLRRLYFDLLVNRVLSFPKDLTLSAEDEAMLKVPEPRAYPRIDASDTQELVPIQYTADLCDEFEWTLPRLWENRKPLLAMAKKIPFNEKQSSSFRLREWLDNYTIRGSFDDRTLVILRKGGDDYGQDFQGDFDGRDGN